MIRGTRILAGFPGKPRGPLLAWVLVAGLLCACLAGLHRLEVVPAQARLDQAAAEWRTARARLAKRLDAKTALKDVAVVLNALPTRRDFTRFPLAVSQAAQRDRVTIPTLSYSLKKAATDHLTKATLAGSATGRYEDLRRFIHHLETAESVVFIENLDVGRGSDTKREALTVNITLSTYIQDGQGRRVPSPALAP